MQWIDKLDTSKPLRNGPRAPTTHKCSILSNTGNPRIVKPHSRIPMFGRPSTPRHLLSTWLCWKVCHRLSYSPHHTICAVEVPWMLLMQNWRNKYKSSFLDQQLTGSRRILKRFVLLGLNSLMQLNLHCYQPERFLFPTEHIIFMMKIAVNECKKM